MKFNWRLVAQKARCFFHLHRVEYLYGPTAGNGYSAVHLGAHCQDCGTRLDKRSPYEYFDGLRQQILDDWKS